MDAICSRVIPGKLRGKLPSRSGRSRESPDRSVISDDRGVVNRLVARPTGFSGRGFFTPVYACVRSDLGSKDTLFSRAIARLGSRRLVVKETETTDVRRANACRIMSAIIRTPTARAQRATNDAGRGTCLND